VNHQQKCLAHLRRHFKQLLKLTVKSQQEIGRVFIKLIDEEFAPMPIGEQTKIR